MVIVDNPESYFIFVYHPNIYRGNSYFKYRGKPLTNKEYLEHWGKWIVFGKREKLDEMARQLNNYVEEEIIPCIKYDRSPPRELGINECVMCVFCDDRQRDEVWEILADLGVELKAWVYERETIEMWMPGGALLEEWIKLNCSSEDEAEKVREESKQRFQEIYDNKDAIYRGWAQ